MSNNNHKKINRRIDDVRDQDMESDRCFMSLTGLKNMTLADIAVRTRGCATVESYGPTPKERRNNREDRRKGE